MPRDFGAVMRGNHDARDFPISGRFTLPAARGRCGVCAADLRLPVFAAVACQSGCDWLGARFPEGGALSDLQALRYLPLGAVPHRPGPGITIRYTLRIMSLQCTGS